MGTLVARTGRLGRFVGAIFCLLGSAVLSAGQGNFPVGEADIIAMQLMHYFPPENKLHEVDFEWSFKKGTFFLKKGKAEIPADLQKKLLPDGKTAEEIEGKWSLKDGKLVLSEIKAGSTEGRKDVSMEVYKTAPTVVRIGYGAPQYAFVVKK